ncbi:MAG: hypothetical protein ACU0CA_14465 [Paracoccaceae bacterium]
MSVATNLIALIATILVGSSTPMFGQSLDEFSSCTNVENDIARLECYDKAASQIDDKSSMNSEDCPLVTLRDLQLDIADLKGKCITTVGNVMSMGPMAMIGEGMADMSPLQLETTALSRSERGIILDCQFCRLEVVGIVGEVMFSPGIIASTIRKSR